MSVPVAYVCGGDSSQVKVIKSRRRGGAWSMCDSTPFS